MVKKYAQRMVLAMRIFAGIKLEIRGKHHLPEGAFILAPKHQSWGDGFCAYSVINNLSFVTNDHLEKIPLLKGVLEKLGTVVVNNLGGEKAREDLMLQAEKVIADGRRLLIYPEGHLSKPGTHHRYRMGIWKLYSEFNIPVVPAATNLGYFWEQTQVKKMPGTTTLWFLPTIQPGLSKEAFMARLETDIESYTRLLANEVMGRQAEPSELVLFEGEKPRVA